ncbi:MAG: WYL domain-containing protein [Bacteroidetes bacterium]|nr:WYL domain-containing protein [Bacteroidota bacterium]
MEEIVLKLESKTVINCNTVRPLIQFETNNLAEGNRHLRELYKHLSKKSVIKIEYKPFGKEAFTCLISPYLLKEYNNRWFLFGKNHQTDYIQNLALDRIEHIEKESVPFIDDLDFNPEEYFKDVIGVSVTGNQTEKILLRFNPEQANYVKTNKYIIHK